MTLDDVSFTMKIAYISRAMPDSERHWTPLDLKPAALFGLPNASEGTVENKVPHILRPQDVGEHWQSGEP